MMVPMLPLGVVLAAGSGRRLQPFTDHSPKCLIDIAGKPLLGRMLDAGLVDVGRTLDPDNNELFTWWPPWRNLRQRNIGWRIDYVLATSGVAARASTAVSRRDFGTSDHAPVIVQFAGMS